MRSLVSLASGAALSVIGAVALWGCGGGSSSGMPQSPAAPGPSGAQTVTVSIVGSSGNQAYRPNPVAANAGDTLVFRNNDSAMHHIMLDDGSADLGDVSPGATSRAFVVKNSTATTYHCTIHRSMVGSINGQQVPTPPPCPDPYGYGC